jgi:siroheme synthase-like protein
MKKKYFPIYVDISAKPVLVVGAGKIAYRKILYLLDFDAEIDCIAPAVIPEIRELADNSVIRLIQREYRKNDSAKYDFVFAATNSPETDRFIYEDCQENGILLNVADVPAFCTFILSSYIKKGDITINISSGGTAPFFVKHLKDTISDCLPEHFEDIALLAAEFRKRLVDDPRYNDEKSRNELLDSFLKTDWTSEINKKDYNGAFDKMIKLF